MKNTSKILLILGTARNERQSEKVAKYVLQAATKFGLEVDYVDIRDNLQLFTEEKDMLDWKRRVTACEGIIIVSPEYNHGYPGELKILLDSAYDEYAKKPVSIIGVSSGLIGGARMIEQLRAVVVELGMIPLRAPALFGRVQTLFDDNGQLKEPADWDKKLQQLFEEQQKFIDLLKE